MILSFICKETKHIYNRQFSRKLPKNIQKTALKKLWMIDAATNFI
jgi:toxin HigB-1